MSILPTHDELRSSEFSALKALPRFKMGEKMTATTYIIGVTVAMGGWLYMLTRSVWAAAVWLAF